MEASVSGLDGAVVHVICRRTNSTQQAVHCNSNLTSCSWDLSDSAC